MFPGPSGERTGAGQPPVILEARGLAKEFGGRRVLDNVDFTVHSGEVHALVGENGSGKSTLIKILAGYHAATSGTVSVAGQPVSPSAASSYAAGCRFVYQDVAGLVGALSILDNLCLLSGYPTRAHTIRTRRAVEQATVDLARVGLRLDPTSLVSALSPAARTGVAVAAALRLDDESPARLIVLDEPTATLPEQQVAELHDTIRAAVATGVGVLYVTHRLDEVFSIADRVTVLRDGRRVGTWATRELSHERLVELMTAGELATAHSEVARLAQPGVPVMSVTGLTAGEVDGVDLEVRSGEIVGIAGVVGSGRESLLAAIFGHIRRRSGSVTLNGQPIRASRPDLSVRRGLAYLPADRKAQAVVQGLNARENLTLSNLRPFWTGTYHSKRKEIEEARSWFAEVDVRPADATEAPLDRFSGGNQQKVVLARLLRHRPAVLLLDEPTHGVDIAARRQLHHHITAAAGAGAGVVITSSDVEELLAVSHRIVVMWQGRVICSLTGGQLTPSEVTKRTMGIGVGA